jgi:hypothetical protein
MARTAHARITPFALSAVAVAALAPLKAGSLNGQHVRLGDGELGAEALVV